MIIVMKQGTPPANVEVVVRRVEELGYKVHLSRGEARTIIGVIGANEHELNEDTFMVMEGVEAGGARLHTDEQCHPCEWCGRGRAQGGGHGGAVQR